MEELKPCPFCGGEAEMIAAKKFKMEPLWPNGAEQPDEYNCWVKCKKCHTVCGAVEYPTEAEAAAAWNRRAAPENKPLTQKQLREMHGTPVWVVPNRGVAKWYLVDVANDACETCDMDVVDFELYGPENKSYGWLAYARRPESAP